MPVRFFLFPIIIDSNVVMILEEEVGGPDSVRHEMDVNDEAQPGVSQAEGVISICPCCLIPGQLLSSVIGSEGRDIPEMNIDQFRSRDRVSGTASDRSTQAEAQIRTYFLTIVEISMTRRI